MPTLIDSLYVEFGLDPKKFTKGQKVVVDALAKTESAAEKAGKKIEKSSDKAAESIERLAKQVLGLYAAMTGINSLTNFVGGLIGADAALGRFSANLGQSAQMVSGWGLAAERFGGSAQATRQTFEGLGKAIYNLRFNGQMLPKEFYQLQAASGKFISTGRDTSKTLVDMAIALKRVYDVDPARAHFLAEGNSIDAGTANLMFKFGAGVEAYVKAREKLAPTAADIAASEDLQEHWISLTQVLTNLADTIVRVLEPVVRPWLDSVSAWVEKNGSVVTDTFRAWGQALQNFFQLKDDNGQTGFDRLITDAERLMAILDKLANGNAGALLSMLFSGTPQANPNMNVVTGNQGRGAAPDPSAGQTHPFFGTDKNLEGSSHYDGARASGGPVSRGRRYLVGERGPEPFIPASNGTILPNGALGGETTVDGKPVSKGNPMPVVLAGQTSASSGGGVFDWIKGILGGSGGGKASGLGPPTGTVSLSGTNRDVVNYIRESAKRNGVDPDTAVRVAAAEGLRGFDPTKQNRGGDGGSSFGPFQLHYGRLNPAMPHNGLGNEFTRQTGLDARNSSTWKEQIDFATKWQAAHGWGDWSGAKKLGITGFHGIKGKRASSGITSGSHLAAALSTIQQNRNVTTSNSSNEMHVGSIAINTQATDSEGIASSISNALSRSFSAMPANYGLV